MDSIYGKLVSEPKFRNITWIFALQKLKFPVEIGQFWSQFRTKIGIFDEFSAEFLTTFENDFWTVGHILKHSFDLFFNQVLKRNFQTDF